MKSTRSFFVRFNAVVFSLLLVVAFYLVSNKTTVAEKSMYSGIENHVISLDAAKKMTDNFQKSASSADLVAGYFGKSIYEKILSQKNCVGIRIYNAKEEAGTPVFVLVGVDANGNDIASGVVGEDIIPCPPFCGKDGGFSSSTSGKIVAMK